MADLDELPAPVAARTSDRELIVSVSDGRWIATPLAWHPVLLAASKEQRDNVEFSPFGVHWPDLDEDLSIAGMLSDATALDGSPPLARRARS